MSQKNTGTTLATAAAALFAAGAALAPAVAQAGNAEVKCVGINSCKGTSACKTATNACKGQNSCKGHGWVPKASAAECTKAGGKVAK